MSSDELSIQLSRALVVVTLPGCNAETAKGGTGVVTVAVLDAETPTVLLARTL